MLKIKFVSMKIFQVFIKFALIFLLSLFTSFSSDRPIVILVSLDGFRWDYLERGVSPYLTEIALKGVKAKSLKPQFPSMTFPNHYSIITGLYPEHHGIIANNFHNPFNKDSFSLKKPNVENAYWYRGEAFWETAKRNNIKTASYFWPGSEMNLEYRRPDYYHSYEHTLDYETRVKGVLDWLKLPDSLNPRFISLYFDETDSKAHRFGTNSKELNQGISRVDSMIRMLDSGLISLKIQDKVNLIVISDHGMTDIFEHTAINIKKILDSDTNNVSIVNHSSLGWIFLKDKSKVNEIYSKLNMNKSRYRVFKKQDFPKRFNYGNHPFIGDIVIVPEIGWHITDGRKWDGKYVATHGFDNEEIDMHGIFLARGPSFKTNYNVGTLNNLDIYPLLCKIFGISHGSKIDGDLDRIIHILKE